MSNDCTFSVRGHQCLSAVAPFRTSLIAAEAIRDGRCHQCLSAVAPFRTEQAERQAAGAEVGHQCLSAVAPFRTLSDDLKALIAAEASPMPFGSSPFQDTNEKGETAFHQFRGHQCLSAVAPFRTRPLSQKHSASALGHQCLSAVAPFRTPQPRAVPAGPRRESPMPFGSSPFQD